MRIPVTLKSGQDHGFHVHIATVLRNQEPMMELGV